MDSAERYHPRYNLVAIDLGASKCGLEALACHDLVKQVYTTDAACTDAGLHGLPRSCMLNTYIQGHVTVSIDRPLLLAGTETKGASSMRSDGRWGIKYQGRLMDLHE